MATTPPLHGLRIIECSALGPAAITTALVDLGADVIKVEPPAGDYIREMTWPIVEGTSLMHLHLNRGKRSLVLDLRTEAGVAILKELATGADVVVEAMRPGALARRGAGYDDLRLLNPKIVFCSISGYGMTGPYRDYPSHGIAYDTWAGIVNVATDDEGFTYIPEHVSIGINAGPLYGALGILAAVIRARETGESSYIDLAQSDAAAAMDWYRSETWRAYERPESEVTGNKADDYERRAPGTAGMVEGVRYQVYEAADGRYVLFMASEQALLEELLRGRRPGRPLRGAGPARSARTTRGATASSSASCATSSAPRRPGNGWSSADGSTRPSRRSTRPRPCSTIPSSPTASHCCPQRTWARTNSSRRCTSSARNSRTPPRRRRWANTPRRFCARCWVMTTIRSPLPGTGAHSGTDT